MLNALRTDNSPFSEQQLQTLKQSLGTLSQAQSLWLSGYLAGRLADQEEAASLPAPAAEAHSTAVLTILYGSETGNGEALAEALAARFEATGLHAELLSLDRFRAAGLKKLEQAVFVMSTHGEGDPPEEALDLFEFLDSDRAPKLDQLRYRVLALGDRSYSLFCEAGRRLDQRLQELGAKPFGPRVDCDVDYAADAQAWSDQVLDWARETLQAETPAPGTARLSVVPTTPAWTRERPFQAEVLKVQKITGLDSVKDVYHLELSLEGSGLHYEPGDALGVWAPNDPVLVAGLLERLALDPAVPVDAHGHAVTLETALTELLELTRLSADTVTAWADLSGRDDLALRFAALSQSEQQAFIEQRQFFDLAEEYPGAVDAQSLASLLRPLGPRSYSIASSGSLVDAEVHLTVATLNSNAIGVPRQGVASQFLNHRVGAGGTVGVFLEPNRRFRLPDNPKAPVILIGAGTGIAPYRAFLQEMEQSGDNPDSWLIFGNPNQRTDFLYQREFLKWRQDGLLNRIDAAWSRDQAHKRYVQHVVAEQAERLDRWLQRGAHVYVCGCLAMGHAVQEALTAAIAQQRGLDHKDASEVVADLRRAKRLHKDLY